jgi:two-component system, OmpR family, sensor histidine kinase BaeS
MISNPDFPNGKSGFKFGDHQKFPQETLANIRNTLKFAPQFAVSLGKILRLTLMMRLRLFHKLFLLIACTALIAALAMAIVLSLSLKRGFTDYLDARDDEQLIEFVHVTESVIAAKGSAAQLRTRSGAWAVLLDEIWRNGDFPGPPRAGFAPPRRGIDQRPPLPGSPPTPPDAPRRRPPPPENFAKRLSIVEMHGQVLWGPTPISADKIVQHPIVVAGETLALAQLLPRGPVPRNVEARFLQRQYRDASLLTLVLLVLATVLAYYFARSGVARMLEMQRATSAIADGDLSARVQVRADDEIAAMGENINHMAVNLQKLDTSRRRWLAEISHELRTPLAVLVGELDALREHVRPLNMDALRSLSEEVQRITRIVGDLHFLALSDLSATPCEFAPCDAVALVRSSVQRVGPEFAHAGITLSLDVGELSTLAVLWDGDRIAQVLSNILSNTLRYTDAPGTAILRLCQVNQSVQLTLIDSAPSVPEADLTRIFEPLFRVETSRARILGGSGLGLAVSDSIVQAHRGSMRATASPLGGVCMQVMLPLDASKNG